MKIAIVSQYFPPDKPGRIADELSQELAARGHSVRVVTTYPHYDTVQVPNGMRQKLQRIESRGDVRVRRVRIIGSHSRNAVARILNYISFAVSARLAGAFIKDADVVYVHGTPATSAEPARVWSRKYGIPYVYHVQDIWPESVTGSGFLPKPLSGLTDRVIGLWLRRVYGAAAAVIAIAPSAGKLFIERGAQESKVRLVYNWARDSYRLAGGRRQGSDRGTTLVYAGNIGALQDLETVVRAMSRTDDRDDLRLIIAGTGVQEAQLRDLVSELNLEERIEFRGKIPPENMGEIYELADFQIVPLKRLEIFGGTIPSKFQAGLAYGVPVITSVAGDVSRIVEENRLGFTAKPENAEDLAAAFRSAHATSDEERREFQERAREFYNTKMTKKQAVTAIESILIATVREGSKRKNA